MRARLGDRSRSRHRATGGRRLVFGLNSPRKAVLAALMSVALLGSGLSTFAAVTSSAPAQAAPGTPGTPQSASVVYAEDFQNVPGPDPILRLPQYTGASGQKYTANTAWLTNCNGWIVSANQSTTAAAQGTDCTPAGATPAQGLGWWNVNQQLAQALGVYNGQSVADARSNYANSDFTGADPGAGKVEFQTASNVPFTASNRFIAFSVDVAAVFCSFSAPLLQFQLLNSAGVASNVGSQVDGCTNGTSVTVPSLGSQGPGTVNVKTVRSNAAVLFSGSSVGVRMLNNNGSGSGNDHAIDNVKILDVTPQLDKAFSPTNIQVGQTSTLTFTVTNTSELAAKNGWSFTDNLPNGLTLASPTAAATTCPAGAVTAAAGGTSIAVTGNLSSGMPSCTITVNVTAASQGTYTNGPANVTETGLNPPGDTTLTVAGPVVTCSTDPNIFNTGFNAATGGILPDNAKDANWQVASGSLQNASVSLPPAGAAWAPANVGNMAPGAWSPSPFGNAQWVSQQTIASPDQGAASDWYYRYQFTIDPTVNPANFALPMTFMADNMVAEVYVNGVAQSGKVAGIPQAPLTPYVGDNATGSYNYPGFVTSTAAQTTLTNDWKTGANTLIVQIKSAPAVEGFNAQIRPSVLCPQPSFTVAKSASSTSTTPGSTVTYTVNVTNTGNVAYTAANPATFTDNLSAVLDDAGYNNDASGGATVNGQTLSWSGPLAVGATQTITYSVTVRNPDNGDHLLTNTVTPGIGGTCAPASSCTTTTPVQSFSVTKTANSNQVVPGDTITYTVTVVNTGQVDYTAAAPASWTDDLTQVLDDATYNNDATGGATYAAPTLSWSGPLAVGATQTITYTVTVNTPDTGDQKLHNAIVTPPGDGPCPAGSTDPACFVDIPSGSYTVAKSASATSVLPGDTVTYTVIVKNTGNLDYTAAAPATLTDDLSGVLDDATYNGDATSGATVSGTDLAWSGPLAIGATVTITYSVTIDDPDTGDKLAKNTVRPTTGGGQCDPSSTCTTTTQVRTFTVAKTSSPAGAVHPGGVVTYTVTVTNTGTGDFTATAPATFTDDLSAVLDDAAYNGDASNGATVTGDTLSWSGALAAGAATTITYSVTVNNPDTGDKVLKNAVVPGDGGDCVTTGGCATTNDVQSFTVSKTSSPAGAVKAGDVITYTVTVKNTGTAAYTAASPASFTDDLSQVIDDATYNNDANNGATYAAPTLSWSGPLAVGAATTVTYSVTVSGAGNGDGQLTNAVVTPPNTGGECAPDGTCSVTNPLQAFTLQKAASSTRALPGDTVTYTITVTNTGQVAYTAAAPATFTDNLSGVLDDAIYNGDATNGATYTAPTLAWALPLAVGATTTVTYSVTVNAPDTGDHQLKNAVVPPVGGTCATPEDCATVTPVQSFSVVKAADTNTVVPGGTITYTITVTNTGAVDYTAADPASWTDDLSAVLDDATYNGDVTGGATYAAPTLSWSGPLALGATATFTYSVTVNDPDTGDKKLHNAVVTPPDGGCIAGSTDPVCFADVPSGTYTVAKTASATEVAPGDTVTYTVRVKNTGQVAYTAAKPASFSDDLSAVLDDATYNGDATNGATFSAPNLTWSGPLAVGQTVTVTYSVTVNNPDTGDKTVKNTVRPTGGGGTCETSDACGTTTQVQSFTVSKASSATSAAPGDVVTYTITVKNTGQAAFTATKPASFTDNLSAVLDDATYNGDATDGASYTEPKLSWALALPVGGTATVTYSITVDSPDAGDHELKNGVVPGIGGQCDPAASCETNDPVAGFTVKKTVDKADARPGATVTYTITVANTGKVDYTTAKPAAFTDDLSEVLDDASYNDDATGGASYAKPVLSWKSPLTVGATTTVTYSVKVDDPDRGDKKLVNAVVTPAGGNCVADADGTGCSVLTNVGDPGAPAGLADTGSKIAAPIGILAGLLILIGAAVAFVSRRRRNASAG